jgi:hypothetical protein
MGRLAGTSVNRLLAGSRYALPDYQSKWRKVTGQASIERMRFLWPLLARVEGNRVDKLIRAARGQAPGGVSGSNLLWRLPAILWRLFV